MVIGAVLAWSGYRAAVDRPLVHGMPPGRSCRDEPGTAADLRGVGGRAPVACESWDIGTGVAGYAWHAPDPRGVVLLQHGWGDHAQRWVEGADRFIPRLLQAGLDVYAFDLYGNGRSPGIRGLVDVDRAVEDHLAARERLRQQDLPVYVVGHSLGGLVSIASVVEDRTDVAGVVLLAPALQYETNAFTRWLTRVGAFLAPTLPGPIGEGEASALSRDPAALDAIRADPLMVLTRLSWLTVAGGANVSHRLFERYPEVTAPVLVVHGTGDTSTSPQGSEAMVGLLGSSDATLRLIPGARHSLLDDTDAEEVAAIVLDWLQQRLH